VLGFIVSLGLFGAALTQSIGIHAIFGSFIVGVAIGASTHLQERTRVMLEEFVSFIFAPVFFASIGLRVNFLANFDAPLVATVLILACTGKLLGGYVGGRWGDLPTRDRWAVSFALNARGAMEIILGLLALEAGVIRQPLFVALVVMALFTSAVSGPLIRATMRQRTTTRKLTASLSPKLFVPHLRAATRRDAIGELAERLAAGRPEYPQAIVEQIAWRRETVAATGIGHGVALPHARLEGLEAPLVAAGLSEAGIDFDAPDGQPAHVIFLIVTPEGEPAAQLDLSAEIAALFKDPRALERVLRAASYTEFLAALKMLEPKRGHSRV
jgi:mannitol/fructose-specific phosphotransferase system IIA component (Ntr-type)